LITSPASYKVEDIVKMLEAGMDIARLNFSHGDHQSHGRLLDNIHEALKKKPLLRCAIMLDTKGPEIRTGLLDKVKSVELVKDQTLEISKLS
jgi:pyruvate kinase